MGAGTAPPNLWAEHRQQTRRFHTCECQSPGLGASTSNSQQSVCNKRPLNRTKFIFCTFKPSKTTRLCCSDAATSVVLSRRAVASPQWVCMEAAVADANVAQHKPNGATPQHNGAARRNSQCFRTLRTEKLTKMKHDWRRTRKRVTPIKLVCQR